MLISLRNSDNTYEKTVPIIKDMLYEIGIPPLLKGYPYIIDAAIMAANTDDISYNEVYSVIALRYGTSSKLVERAIRHAIDISWSWEGNRSLKNYYSESQAMPTNGEFFDFLNNRV